MIRVKQLEGPRKPMCVPAREQRGGDSNQVTKDRDPDREDKGCAHREKD
jgi:hypothetical protein